MSFNSQNQPIDIVIPWVDDTDPVWKAERAKYLGEFHEKKSNLSHYFRDWDTLRYVFRSIEKHMPWVRKVHFLTCGHVPQWMNLDAEKLHIHKHSDFFTEDSSLPVFSSRPIEMNMMNIPGLSDRFVYFNDDTVVMKPITSERFFRGNIPIDYLILDIPRGGWLYDKIRIKEPYAQTVKNSIRLLNQVFPLAKLYSESPELFFDHSYKKSDRMRTRLLALIRKYKWIKVNHNPQPFILSYLKECERLFPKEISETRKHRFRAYTDLNQYLFRDYALMSGHFHPHYFDDDFCLVLASVERYRKERHFIDEKTFICLNDSPFLLSEEYPALREMVINDMEAAFPEKSSFEK